MLGTGKRGILMSSEESSIKDLLSEFLQIGNASKNVANFKASDILGLKGSRTGITPSTIEELADKDVLYDSITETPESREVSDICNIISTIPDPYRRRCACAIFLEKGYRDITLSTDTGDTEIDKDNESINSDIRKFYKNQSNIIITGISDLYIAIDHLSPIARDWYSNKYQGFFDPSNSTSNIRRDLDKVQHSGSGTVPHDPEFTNEMREDFTKAIMGYRKARSDFDSPTRESVCRALNISPRVLKENQNDILKRILSSAGSGIIKRG